MIVPDDVKNKNGGDGYENGKNKDQGEKKKDFPNIQEDKFDSDENGKNKKKKGEQTKQGGQGEGN
jgi:hypothetical protein